MGGWGGGEMGRWGGGERKSKRLLNCIVYDRTLNLIEHGQYLTISEDWQEKQHFHACLIHLEIINDKVWIRCDNTEQGIANELISVGIP
ncbi:MAG: XisI protein [Symploca sp. SIO2E6]|nr:XisI protein [Symploca sp. SIO2E6]